MLICAGTSAFVGDFSLDKVIKNDNTWPIQWVIEFYSENVERDTFGFPAGILAHFIHILEIIRDIGPNLGMPYTRPMGDGLFEIRSKGKEGIGRSLFCTIKGRKIIILHSFIKKSAKTPKRELKIAMKRMKEVKS